VPRGRRKNLGLDEAVRFLSELAIAVGDAARRVRPPTQRDLLVVDRDVRMVVLGFRKLADAVHERERFREGRELERALERPVDLAPAFDAHDGSIYDRCPMPASTEDAARTVDAEPRRAGRELVLDLVFRPLSNALAPLLARLGVAPPAVVLANAAVGLVAALVIARGELVAGALLLQLKTLLDNSDGQLARVSGRVTLTGRYLDTEADLVVNAAIFATLGYETGEALLAAAAFVALTIVLAVDFNVTELARKARGTQPSPPLATGSRVEHVLERVYELVYEPLDRGIRRLWTRAEVDGVTTTILANLGLSTQLVVLGVCLVVGVPEAYLWLVLVSVLPVVALAARRRREA
jgi:archaetidylinositol phosphate synthase